MPWASNFNPAKSEHRVRFAQPGTARWSVVGRAEYSACPLHQDSWRFRLAKVSATDVEGLLAWRVQEWLGQAVGEGGQSHRTGGRCSILIAKGPVALRKVGNHLRRERIQCLAVSSVHL